MNRIKLRKGDKIFVNTLQSTDDYLGINNEMNDMIGNYVEVRRLSGRYPHGIQIFHPKSRETYTVHCSDVSLEPLLKKVPRKIIKVEHAIKGKFDVNTLSV